jgi:formylglycine-generating enzyme required for sulfatase activity
MKKKSALLGASLMLVLAFLACSFPGAGGGTPTAGEAPAAEPAEPTVPAEPGVSPAPSNTDGAETILIPGGTFWMGSEDGDAQADADEMPRHEVTLEAFPIYTHEVTNAMYAACVEARACIPVNALPGGPTSHYGDPSFAEYPVSGVDWLMARDYCQWASGRLPSEAEWELASRGAESLLYPWGEEEPDCERVNMSGCLVPPDTVRVGAYELGNSPYEVWDLSGNVWEWVHDWYDEDTYYFFSGLNPLGPNFSQTKVVRGGGLYSEPTMMRSAARQPANPHRPYDDVGFRCVAMSDLELPGGYVPVDEVHESVPGPLGETVEEPGGIEVFRTDGGVASCPEPDGSMRIVIGATSSVAVEYSVTLEGNPFDCTYDDSLGHLHCQGPVPADNDEIVRYLVEVRFGDAGPTRVVYVDRPTDCEPGSEGPFEVSASASCPEDGWVTVIFRYEPPMRLDTLQLDGADVMWWPLGDNQTNAIVPARPFGVLYPFYMHGSDAEGREYSSWPVVGLPAECEPEQLALYVDPICSGDRPMVRIAPLSIGDLESASIGGTPLACMGAGIDDVVCGELPGPPDSMVTITLCLAGEPCSDWELAVPACPAGETGFTYEIFPSCLPTFGPVTVIRYFPADQRLVSANADGTDMICLATVPAWYSCTGILGVPGSEVTVTFCLADGSCYSAPIAVRDCAEEEEPSDPGFTLAGLGCHDETHIFFIIDTGLEWLVPGAAYTYSAWDEDHSYACSVHPTIPGRLYCSGDRPDAPGTMQICVNQDGPAPLMCDYFDGWPAEAATIPDCAPPPPPPVASCSSYLLPTTCDLAPGCHWEKGPLPPQGCYPD